MHQFILCSILRTRAYPSLSVWVGSIICVVFLSNNCVAQNPHFSQYYAASLYLNPALAGAERDLSFSLNHRTQWRSLGFPQYTSQLSVILPVLPANPKKPSRYGWGFTAHNDVAGQGGSLMTTGADLSFAYNIPFDALVSQMVTLSGQVGVVQKRISTADLQWGSQFDSSIGYNPDLTSSFGDNAVSTVFPVFNAGMVWFFNPRKNWRLSEFSAYAGIAATNLNQPNESLFDFSPQRLPLGLKLHGGADWRISPKVHLSPALLWMQQNGNQQVNLGSYLSYQLLGNPRKKNDFTRVSTGIWYRFGDSFIASVGITRLRYALGFSYDINVSTLRQYTHGRGAFEISMSYRIINNTGIRRFAVPMM